MAQRYLPDCVELLVRPALDQTTVPRKSKTGKGGLAKKGVRIRSLHIEPKDGW